MCNLSALSTSLSADRSRSVGGPADRTFSVGGPADRTFSVGGPADRTFSVGWVNCRISFRKKF